LTPAVAIEHVCYLPAELSDAFRASLSGWESSLHRASCRYAADLGVTVAAASKRSRLRRCLAHQPASGLS